MGQIAPTSLPSGRARWGDTSRPRITEPSSDRERREVAADEQQVAPAPPRCQQPEPGHEPGEPEGPEHGTEVLGLQGRDERPQHEQGHQAEEHIRAHDDLAIQAQRHQQRHRQGGLRQALADDRGDMQNGHPGVEGQGVEEQQAIGDVDPAPYVRCSAASADARRAVVPRRGRTAVTDALIGS